MDHAVQPACPAQEKVPMQSALAPAWQPMPSQDCVPLHSNAIAPSPLASLHA